MYVKIELFKTNFDEENVFVGTPSKTVDTVLDGFAASEKLVLPLSPFNLKYPFRLAIPYFSIARKYNYARYRFYNTQDETATPADTRFYFVEDFLPIDDQSTEIRAREDILARVFYDLTYQSFLPDRMTYKKNVKDNKLFSIAEYQSTRYKQLDQYEGVGFYNVLAVYDTNYGGNSNSALIGGLIITAVTSSPTENNTIEGGVSYPILTLLLPFAFDVNSLSDNSFNLITDRKFRAGGSVGVGEVASIDGYLPLSQYTDNGFKIISADINFNLGGYFDAEKVEGYTDTYYDIYGTLKYSEIELETIELARRKYIRIKNNKASGKIDLAISRPVSRTETQYITISDVLHDYAFDNSDELFQIPFHKFTIRTNGKFTEINPLYIERSDLGSFRFTQSFIPPYSKGITFTAFRNFDNIYAFDATTQFSFFSYDDTYAEFLRANYNSQITGLKVRQQSEREVLGIRSLSSAGSNIVSGISRTVAGAIKGGAVGATAAGVSAVGSAVNNAINTAANSGELSINQEKEQRLLDLKLQDVQNLPDTVNLGNAIGMIWSEKLFFIFAVWENAAILTYRETIKRYGVSSPTRSETMVNHSVFDYVRCTDITFTQKTITLSEVERAAVEKYFRDGVRLWYDYSHYKDFNADNPEV